MNSVMRVTVPGKRLGWLFALAVLVPGIALALIAVRSIYREEAYIEKQLEATLLAEVTHLVSLVQTELGRIETELADSAPLQPLVDPQQVFAGWRGASDLVASPFVLSPRFEILWPRGNGNLDAEQQLFLRLNSEFLSNRVEVPVFEELALAYKDELLPAEPLEEQAKTGAVEKQLARSQFQMSEEIQEKIYDQAMQEGLRAQSRVLAPSAAGADQQPPPSMFISRDLRLDEITKDRDQGLVPRIADNRLSLLFWKKIGDGQLVGCVISDPELRDRLVGLIPDFYSSVRILTLVDEQGQPLLAPEDSEPRDYRRPFVARECSAILPLWEAAAYLSDPGIVSSQARRIGRILWVLICLLFVSIAVGGILVLRSVQAESLSARRRTGFVANVSHELKTPLTSIRMFAEMLKTGSHGSEGKRQQYLSLMVSESERLTRLINNVLDFSNMEKGRKQYSMETVDAGQLFRDLVENQRPRFQRNGFQLQLSVGTRADADGALRIRGDAESLKQSLLNLLSNAEKYSDDRKLIEVVIRREGSWVYVDVMDRGKGVPAAQAERIFDEFYRGDDSLTARVRGSGLGLSITRRIIRDHGGEVLYVPREGGGSIFRIRLPAADIS